MKRHKSRLLIWGLLGVVLLSAGVAWSMMGGGHNQPPVIRSLTATPGSVQAWSNSTVTVVVYNPNGDPLSYSWTASGGTISSPHDGPSVTWTAPQPGTYTVTVTVSHKHMMGGCMPPSPRSVEIIATVPPLPAQPPARKNIGVVNWQEVSPK